MQKLIKNTNLHSQSVQGLTDKFYDSWKAYKEAKKLNPNAKPPKRRKKYFCLIYKESAIKIKDNKLILSNGKNNKPLVFNNWKYDKPKYVEISYNNGYKMSCTYSLEEVVLVSGEIASIDLGAIHIASIYTGDSEAFRKPIAFNCGLETQANGQLLGNCPTNELQSLVGDKVLLYSGKEIRSKQRYSNKIKADFSAKLSKLKKHSRKYKKLNKKKRKILNKIKNQIRDIEHKQTTHLVETLDNLSVATVVIGDLRNVRKSAPKTSLKHKKSSTQQVNQMPTGKTRVYITYKAKRVGIKVVLINESYTSQTCPSCNTKNKVSNREYVCSCGFKYHRDGVGAINIYRKYIKKYQGYVPVVGAMTPPIGKRYKA